MDSTLFDVRDIPCRIKHGLIFKRWADTPVGGFFVLVNDHDPVPLYHQFAGQFPGAFTWEYLRREQDEIHVKISRLAATEAAAPSGPSSCGGHHDHDDEEFDVRPIPPRVKHAQIFQRWFDLPVGGHFVLLNDHDPAPLRYQFLAEFPGAFDWQYIEEGPEEFRVRITKLQAVAVPARFARPATTNGSVAAPIAGDVQQIDARGLEPPEPLIRILNALEALPRGIRLRAITDRHPCHLFGEAEQRGFRHESAEQPDGSWVTTLQHA